MTEQQTTAYTPVVGDRVRFIGLDADTRRALGAGEGGGAWELLKAGSVGTVEALAPKAGGNDRFFFIADDVEMPYATLSTIIGMPTGWPLLGTEVEKV